MRRTTGTVVLGYGVTGKSVVQPLHHPLVQQAKDAHIPIYSDIDLFMAKVDMPVIGVTGTNGKSTVVSLVGHLLQASELECVVGGNLGEPALQL